MMGKSGEQKPLFLTFSTGFSTFRCAPRYTKGIIGFQNIPFNFQIKPKYTKTRKSRRSIPQEKCCIVEKLDPGFPQLLKTLWKMGKTCFLPPKKQGKHISKPHSAAAFGKKSPAPGAGRSAGCAKDEKMRGVQAEGGQSFFSGGLNPSP